MDFTRRGFVTGAVGFVWLAPTAVAASAGESWAFPAASGRRTSGLLVSADPLRHEAELEALRRRTGYFRPLAYASTDRSKAAFAAAVIDYRAADGLSFMARDGRDLPLPSGARAATSGRFPNLEQMAAFLTGCAFAAAHGAAHPLKRALAERYQATAV